MTGVFMSSFINNLKIHGCQIDIINTMCYRIQITNCCILVDVKWSELQSKAHDKCIKETIVQQSPYSYLILLYKTLLFMIIIIIGYHPLWQLYKSLHMLTDSQTVVFPLLMSFI